MLHEQRSAFDLTLAYRVLIALETVTLVMTV